MSFIGHNCEKLNFLLDPQPQLTLLSTFQLREQTPHSTDTLHACM